MSSAAQPHPTDAGSMTPHDKACAAISIIQAHLGASDSNLVMDKIFGTFYMPAACLELAAKLLADVLEPLAELECEK